MMLLELSRSSSPNVKPIGKNPALVSGLDVNDPAQAVAVFERLRADPYSLEWFSYLASFFAAHAQNAISNHDAARAALCAERYRSLSIFKKHFEDVVYMGHSAADLPICWPYGTQIRRIATKAFGKSS